MNTFYNYRIVIINLDNCRAIIQQKMWNKNESNQFTHVYKGIKMFKNYSSFENYLETYIMAWKTNILCEKTASCKSDDI